MIKVDNTKRYNQLAIELLKRIFNGYYKLDARLPSTREMISEIFGKELIPYCVQCAKIHLHKKTNKMENLWHNVLANLFAHQYKDFSIILLCFTVYLQFLLPISKVQKEPSMIHYGSDLV